MTMQGRNQTLLGWIHLGSHDREATAEPTFLKSVSLIHIDVTKNEKCLKYYEHKAESRDSVTHLRSCHLLS